MANLEMTNFQSFIIVAIGIFSSNCMAQASMDRVLDASGAYIAAGDMNERLNNSTCGSFITRKNPLNRAQAISDVTNKLDGVSLTEFNAYVGSSDFNIKIKRNEEILAMLMRQHMVNQPNIGFACGKLVGTIYSYHKPIFDNWNSLP